MLRMHLIKFSDYTQLKKILKIGVCTYNTNRIKCICFTPNSIIKPHELKRVKPETKTTCLLLLLLFNEKAEKAREKTVFPSHLKERERVLQKPLHSAETTPAHEQAALWAVLCSLNSQEQQEELFTVGVPECSHTMAEPWLPQGALAPRGLAARLDPG